MVRVDRMSFLVFLTTPCAFTLCHVLSDTSDGTDGLLDRFDFGGVGDDDRIQNQPAVVLRMDYGRTIALYVVSCRRCNDGRLTM